MALLAAGVLGWATLAGSVPAPADTERTIVVAQDGSGDATTVAAGVGMARGGDTVLVRPGRYVERVEVRADIEIRGDGAREDVVVAAPEDAGRFNDGTPVGVAFTFRGSYGSLSDLTVLGSADGRAISVEDGGAPIISNVVIRAADAGSDVAMWWSGGANGVIRDSEVTGVLGMDGAGTAPVIEFNRLPRTCLVVRFDGQRHADQPRPVIRQNRIAGCPGDALIRAEAGSLVVEDNDLTPTDGTGISLMGSAGVVRRNAIHDAGIAILVANPRGAVAVTDNVVHGNVVAIGVLGDGDAVRITGNDLYDNALALNLASVTDAEIAGNTLCDNGDDMRVVPAGGDAPSLDGNVACQASGWFPGA
ncbi:MAG: right-handed parallel beta-helix repeat-containing protein [Chloroflexota bacterium]